MADFEDRFSTGIEDHHGAQAIVHFEGHDQPAKRRCVARADRLVDPLGIGDQADRRHLAALELDRGVQCRVLGVSQLVGNAVLQRRRDQVGCISKAHIPQRKLHRDRFSRIECAIRDGFR